METEKVDVPSSGPTACEARRARRNALGVDGYEDASARRRVRQKVADLLIRAVLAAREPPGLSGGERDQERGDREDPREVLLLAHRLVATRRGRRGSERTFFCSSLSNSESDSFHSEQEGGAEEARSRMYPSASELLELLFGVGRDHMCARAETDFATPFPSSFSSVITDRRHRRWARPTSSLASLCTHGMRQRK